MTLALRRGGLYPAKEGNSMVLLVHRYEVDDIDEEGKE